MNSQREGWFGGDNVPCEPQPPLHHRPRRLVLLGPPGVGKGTQAQLLSQKLRACHLATGDLFRKAKCDGAASPAMAQALEAMRQGRLISDELVVDMVRERTQCLMCRGGFLLDGFPRTAKQADALEELLQELGVQLDAAILFDLPIEVIVDRLAGRRTCTRCQAPYHVSAFPPRRADMCDHCDGELIRREDDAPQAIRVRMKAYLEATRPLVEYYADQDRLVRVHADGPPQDVLKRTLASLEERGASGRSLDATAPRRA